MTFSPTALLSVAPLILGSLAGVSVALGSPSAGGQPPTAAPPQPPALQGPASQRPATRGADERSQPPGELADPTQPSGTLEKILAEIEAVKELRAENERLRAALERGQARPGGGLAIELRGIVVGASSSAALIHVGTRQWLVRVGDHLPLGPAGPGAEDAVVLSIDGDQVELQLGPEGRLQLR